MKQVKLQASLAIRLTAHQRRAVELLAEQEEMSLGEAARELLDEGIRARGLVI
jgi:hypothetical protein